MPRDSITLHPKHGLAPTIPVCIYCLEAKNEVALLGIRWREDRPPPMHMHIDTTPCETCDAAWRAGYVTLIELKRPPSGERKSLKPEQLPDYHAGFHWRMRAEAWARILGRPVDHIEQFAFIDREVATKLGLPRSDDDPNVARFGWREGAD